MRRAFGTSLAHAFRRTALPLAAYYGVTLGLPLANGASRTGLAFVQHALVVVAVPPAAIIVACSVHTVVRAAVNRLGRCPWVGKIPAE